jgi:hypothetical protein
VPRHPPSRPQKIRTSLCVEAARGTRRAATRSRWRRNRDPVSLGTPEPFAVNSIIYIVGLVVVVVAVLSFFGLR